MIDITKKYFNSEKELALWNDRMVEKYHSEGTLFESKNPILRRVERNRIKFIIKLAQVSRTDRFIDIGCGEGYLLSLLSQTKQIVGLDISKVALARAKELLKEKPCIHLIYGNAQKLSFADNSFDKIVCSELLEHVPDPKSVIKEIYRVLKKEGVVVISIPDEKRIQNIMRVLKFLGMRKLIHSARKKEDYEWHLYISNLKFVQDIIEDFFKILEVKRVPYILGYRFIIKLCPIGK